jgi:PAS domain-containing protein
MLQRMLNGFAGVEHVTINEGGAIVDVNAPFARHIGVPRADLCGRRVAEFLSAGNVSLVEGWAAGDDLPREPHLVNFVTAGQQTYTLRCVVERWNGHVAVVGEAADAGSDDPSEVLLEVNNEFATLTRELGRQRRELERAHLELSATLQNLEQSYWHLRKIQEVMPVCMGCGQVKADGYRWQSVVDYLRSNEIFLSHGYCPPCASDVAKQYGLEEE